MSKELEMLKYMKRIDGNLSREQNQRYAELEKALKRHEAMKVLISNNTGIFSGKCGNCGKLFYKIDGILNFCYSCGQKLDWEMN